MTTKQEKSKTSQNTFILNFVCETFCNSFSIPDSLDYYL